MNTWRIQDIYNPSESKYFVINNSKDEFYEQWLMLGIKSKTYEGSWLSENLIHMIPYFHPWWFYWNSLWFYAQHPIILFKKRNKQSSYTIMNRWNW